ncbi:MAG: hypothetical protein ACEQSA_01070 [Weeksellaceae bacterium]
MKNNISRVALITIALLMIPFVFQWPWGVIDFLLMGTLIFGIGSLVTYAATKVKNTKQRIVVIVGLLVLFFVLWAQMAVGLVGKMILGAECVIQRGLPEVINCADEVRQL